MKTSKKIKSCSPHYVSPVKRCGRGFSLIEMMVSMFIMVVIVTTVTAVFAKSFEARKKAREYQTYLEEARTAIETIAKNMRMSSYASVIGEDSDHGGPEVVMNNNSQKACIRYRFSEGRLYQSIVSGADPTDDCLSADYDSNEGEMISKNVSYAYFRVIKTDVSSPNPEIGRGMIWIKTETQILQTSVSFRDYWEVIR